MTNSATFVNVNDKYQDEINKIIYDLLEINYFFIFNKYAITIIIDIYLFCKYYLQENTRN